MKGKIQSAEDIVRFAQMFRENRLSKIKASEEIKEIYKNGVYVLDHQNFNSSIRNITKNHDLIVLYHRENEDMVEIYEEFIKVANEVEDLQFGRYNIEKNENNIQLEYQPYYLMYFEKGSGRPFLMNHQSREIEEKMSKWEKNIKRLNLILLHSVETLHRVRKYEQYNSHQDYLKEKKKEHQTIERENREYMMDVMANLDKYKREADEKVEALYKRVQSGDL